MKKIIIGVVVAALALTGLSACGEYENTDAQPEYYGVCVDPNTDVRLEDDACGTDEDGEEDSDFLAYAVIWYLLASGNSRYPAVGGRVDRSQVFTSLPAGKTARMGLNKSGGSIEPVKTKSSSKSNTNKSKSRSGGSKSSGGRRR